MARPCRSFCPTRGLCACRACPGSAKLTGSRRSPSSRPRCSPGAPWRGLGRGSLRRCCSSPHWRHWNSAGPGIPCDALVEATLDGHPLAIVYVSRLPDHTVVVLRRHHFYADVMKVQRGRHITAAAVPAAAADAKRLNVGWVLVWKPVTPALHHFLAVTGFGFRYRAD